MCWQKAPLNYIWIGGTSVERYRLKEGERKLSTQSKESYHLVLGQQSLIVINYVNLIIMIKSNSNRMSEKEWD